MIFCTFEEYFVGDKNVGDNFMFARCDNLSGFTTVNSTEFVSSTIIICSRWTLTLDNFSSITSYCVTIICILPSTVASVRFLTALSDNQSYRFSKNKNLPNSQARFTACYRMSDGICTIFISSASTTTNNDFIVTSANQVFTK